MLLANCVATSTASVVLAKLDFFFYAILFFKFVPRKILVHIFTFGMTVREKQYVSTTTRSRRRRRSKHKRQRQTKFGLYLNLSCYHNSITQQHDISQVTKSHKKKHCILCMYCNLGLGNDGMQISFCEIQSFPVFLTHRQLKQRKDGN